MPRLNEHNTVLLSRSNLPSILEYLSERLFASFGCQVHIVAHGGAVMVLHPKLACRSSTRDIDFCLRSFVTEWQKKGFYDAEARLNKCIKATAKHFGLGEDWMNAHADVALPMATDSKGRPYDPIYYDAINPNNIANNSIYSSRGLLLIGVTWPWAVALKLVRYQKDDPTDIAHILTLGFRSQGIEWTEAIMEDWLKKACSAMGYDWYPREVMEQTRQRMSHAISLALNLLTQERLRFLLRHHLGLRRPMSLVHHTATPSR
ncbi:hypothetical protein K474DRAFT_1692423 [Panus rudis PR-1116 ss-1]|nr:hypothetical protein K474DRAFT_1692423 [Panus rudis PR-1116 ss-1]